MKTPDIDRLVEEQSSLIWLSAGIMLAAVMVVCLHGGFATVAK